MATRTPKLDPVELRTVQDNFAWAILNNPHCNQMLFGNPLQPHKCEEHDSVGSYLEDRTYQLAVDYMTAQAGRS